MAGKQSRSALTPATGLARARDMGLTPERAAKRSAILGSDALLFYELETYPGTIPDINGSVGAPLARTRDLLAAMLQSGTIDGPMEQAGRRFQRDFHRARLDPAAIPALDRLTGNHRPPGDMANTTLDARQSIADAIKHLGGHGSPPAQALWFTVGADMSIADFVTRYRANTGRAVCPAWARGTIAAALACLNAFYEGRDRKSSV